MTNRADEREPQWGPTYAEQTAGQARRQTELLEGIGRTLQESGNRDYTDEHPVVHADMSGVRDALQSVSSHYADLESGLSEVGDIMHGGLNDLAGVTAAGNEILWDIKDEVWNVKWYASEISDAVEVSNKLQAAIGVGMGAAAVAQAQAAKRREQQLKAIDKTLRKGFEDVQEELEDVRHAVEGGLADVAGAVHRGAERVAEAVGDGFSVQHRLLHALGISLERHSARGHLQFLALMGHLMRIHTAEIEVQRQESASIQATMRDLAANGLKIKAEERYKVALESRAIGNTQAAVRDLRRALKKRSSFAEAWYMLGAIALESGGFNEARNAFALAVKYAHGQDRRKVEEQALNALIELERFLRNEAAWRDLLLTKYERKFKMDRNTELFEVLRTWLKRCPDLAQLTSEQQEVLKKELPWMVRRSESCGVLVATQSEFALVRPHLADGVEQFGSWAYLFWDLNVIALRALCLYYHGKCSCCGKELPEHIRPPLLDLARAIRALLRTALQEFSHGVPVQFVTSYRGLMEARRAIHNVVTCQYVCNTPGPISWIQCETATHEFNVRMLQVFKAVPNNV